jgi:F-type H+-transporting ATPase subunit b
MNVNATLLVQIATFLGLVWFVMKFLWGPLTQMMEDRKQRVADGLAAAERGKHEQELAEKRAKGTLHDAKEKAAEIIAKAEQRAAEIVEEAKREAKTEGERLLTAARAEVGQEATRAREQLRDQVSKLVVDGAEKILRKEINAAEHERLLRQLAANL